MKVTFRALFAGPIGKLNPSGWHAPKPDAIEIEVFARRSNRITTWHARIVAKNVEFRQIEEATHCAAKAAIAECFSIQHSPGWTAYATNKAGVLAPIEESEIEEQPDGRFKRKQLTHAANPQQTEGGNFYTTVCGERVHAIHLRSRRGNVEPTCKVCLADWKQHKEQPRI